MDLEDDRHIRSDLEQRILGCRTAVDVADIVVGAFEEIELALRPVVGGRGVVALFNRSIHLASVRRAWLRGDAELLPAALDLAALAQAFRRQDLEEAAIGGSDLLQTFRTLLSTLIGGSLTEKLLQPAWNRFSGDAVGKAFR